MKHKLEYLGEIWNWNDIAYLTLGTVLLVANIATRIQTRGYLKNFDADDFMTKNEQRTVAAVCVIPLFFKIIDWMRLFESTTFFVGLMT